MCARSVVCAVLLLLLLAVTASPPPPCDSDVYCHGRLLHVVQMAQIFPDSKTFVDMKMQRPRNETLQRFRELMSRTHDNPNKTDVYNFVNSSFDAAGHEFEEWDPVDWNPRPKVLDKIDDAAYREWARRLNQFWKALGRKMKDEVQRNSELYSIIYVPNPVIVPGGRFREFYYWDSYWIVRGLLLCGMHATVRGMLENFLSMVQTYGFVPNGGRIYYTRRSQPPLLIPMAKSYLDATGNLDFLKQNIHILEQEFSFWMTNRTVQFEKDGENYTLARYSAVSSGPRPESYREDYETAQTFTSEQDMQHHYVQLKTAAESGWDFSTRWFIVNATNKGNLTNTMAQYIIPVELNAILYWNAQLLSEFYDKLDVPTKSISYRRLAEEWLQAVTEVLWHDKIGMWLDYDIHNGVKRNYFFPSNLAPLWTGCFKPKELQVGKIMKYLQRSQIMVHLGGIPTSLEYSGEQWDYPNAWPPLQYIVIMALEATNDPWAQELAYEIAERWVRANFKTFNESQVMFEKYDATFPGGHGTGGEYENQVGFGWTNGVILELLDTYGHRLKFVDSIFSPDHHQPPLESGGSLPGLSHAVLTLTAVYAALTICQHVAV